ncbi:MAG: hypothetical protein KAS32_23935 [Candidatus Peribacteraceae bacterium]|nr:hypothetical protein [Candidatus Peribacteraceae bacterium]
MKEFGTGLVLVLIVVPWIAGVVIAKGIWSILAAIFFAPWAWYLTIEHIMKLNGWL